MLFVIAFKSTHLKSGGPNDLRLAPINLITFLGILEPKISLHVELVDHIATWTK